MDIKNYLKALPAMAALLLTASCSSSDNEIVEAPQPAQTRIIPYEVTVGSGNETRSTLNSSGYYVFETGDKLYVWGTNISGTLDLISGNGSSSATFSGNLTWSGIGDPADDLTLNAVVVGPSDAIFGTFDEFKDRGYVPVYSTDVFAASNEDAVQMFSHFQTTSTYGDAKFSFYEKQNSAFLSFDITLEDGTAANAPIDVIINNGGSEVRSGSVTTVSESGAIHAKFITGFPGDGSIKMNGANVKLGDRDAISFGGATWLLSNAFYKVAKTYTRYKITATAATLSVSEDLNNLVLPYETTLGALLGSKAAMLNSLTVKSGTNITFGTFSKGTTPVTVSSIGTTVITVSATISLGDYSYDIEDDVTLVVEKMTPPVLSD